MLLVKDGRTVGEICDLLGLPIEKVIHFLTKEERLQLGSITPEVQSSYRLMVEVEIAKQITQAMEFAKKFADKKPYLAQKFQENVIRLLELRMKLWQLDREEITNVDRSIHQNLVVLDEGVLNKLADVIVSQKLEGEVGKTEDEQGYSPSKDYSFQSDNTISGEEDERLVEADTDGGVWQDTEG